VIPNAELRNYETDTPVVRGLSSGAAIILLLGIEAVTGFWFGKILDYGTIYLD
jgi:hypothetical protein